MFVKKDVLEYVKCLCSIVRYLIPFVLLLYTHVLVYPVSRKPYAEICLKLAWPHPLHPGTGTSGWCGQQMGIPDSWLNLIELGCERDHLRTCKTKRWCFQIKAEQFYTIPDLFLRMKWTKGLSKRAYALELLELMLPATTLAFTLRLGLQSHWGTPMRSRGAVMQRWNWSGLALLALHLFLWKHPETKHRKWK